MSSTSLAPVDNLFKLLGLLGFYFRYGRYDS